MKELTNPLTREIDICQKDPSFSMKYAQLFEEKENGKACSFNYSSEEGRVDYVFLKRKVPYLIEGKEYFDITTPYGYGGPVITEQRNNQKLLKGFFEAFHTYCLEQNIISEFVRFHLFESEGVRKHFMGQIERIGPHVVKDLTVPLNKDMSKDILRSINKFNKLGLEISIDETGEKYKDFLFIYNEMLKRNDATNYYYYNDSFFEKMHETMKGQFVYANAKLNGQTVASRLTLYGSEYSFGFLGASLKDFFYTRATPVVDYHILKYLKNNGCQYFSFGGGYNNNDGIYQYKKKFNKGEDKQYFLGKKIHQKDIYDQLVMMHYSKSPFNLNSNFFPHYRI